MVAALLGGIEDRMSFFNHVIEYLPVCDYLGSTLQYQGTRVRRVIIYYDNILGQRREYRFAAPENLWTHIRVGGTKSNSSAFTVGVLATMLPPKYSVLIDVDTQVWCYAIQRNMNFYVGQKVIVFDHMEHTIPGDYGKFNKALITRLDIADQLDLHSVNIIIFQDYRPIGTIHIDPLLDTPNYDDCKIQLVDGRLWRSEEFLVL